MLSAGSVLLQSKPQILRLSEFSAYIAVRYFVIAPGFLFSLAPVSPYVFHLRFYIYIFLPLRFLFRDRNYPLTAGFIYDIIKPSNARLYVMERNFTGQFKKGALELIILCIIGPKERYGYEIISELNLYRDTLGEALEGTVYPILHRLHENGLIKFRYGEKSARGSRKKYYSLTPEGDKALSDMKKFWLQFSECVDSALGIRRESIEMDILALSERQNLLWSGSLNAETAGFEFDTDNPAERTPEEKKRSDC